MSCGLLKYKSKSVLLNGGAEVAKRRGAKEYRHLGAHYAGLNDEERQTLRRMGDKECFVD